MKLRSPKGRSLRGGGGLVSALLMICLILGLLFAMGFVHAQDLQPIPALTARVIDTTGTLTPGQRQALDDKLAGFEAQSGPQIVMLLVPSTQPEDIAAYAFRVADQWKIGRRDVGDGLLVLVAKNDRKMRIEVARALEGAVPDLAARQIIDQAMKPAFRAGDYAGGLSLAADQLMARIRGEGLPAPVPSAPGARQTSAPSEAWPWDQLAMFFFIGVPIVGAVLTGVLGRKLGALTTGGAAAGLAWWLSASLVLGAAAGGVALVLVGLLGVGSAGGRRGGGRGGPPIIWGGGGGGWGGGSGGGGGGFSSGGGGSFGGGGASGDW